MLTFNDLTVTGNKSYRTRRYGNKPIVRARITQDGGCQLFFEDWDTYMWSGEFDLVHLLQQLLAGGVPVTVEET